MNEALHRAQADLHAAAVAFAEVAHAECRGWGVAICALLHAAKSYARARREAGL